MLWFETMMECCKATGQVKVLDRISKANPFVFLAKKTVGVNELIYSSDDSPADIPFGVCSFELNGQLSMYLKDQRTGVLNFTDMVCIVAEENVNGKTIFYTLSRDLKTNVPRIDWFHPDDHGSDEWVTLNDLVKTLLKRLSTERHGHTSPRTVVKWKQGGVKKQVRINKVIYVGGNNSPEETTGTRSIIWSHAFWVMGHWRNISGIGKDRAGNYGISGRTWVSSYVKNDELGDPILKIRAVKEIV